MHFLMRNIACAFRVSTRVNELLKEQLSSKETELSVEQDTELQGENPYQLG